MGANLPHPQEPRAETPPRKRRLRRIGLGLALGFAILASGGLGLGFAHFVLRLETVEARPARHADGMVALTGGADRVADAIELLADGQAGRLLITGVNPLTSREDLARRLPRVRSMIECCVVLGYQALNTAGNAAETAQWVRENHIRSLIVVTSNYHMPRALAEIASAVPDVDLVAYPVVSERAKAGAWWASPHRARLMVWEYLKYVAVLARLRLTPRGETQATTIVATGSR